MDRINEVDKVTLKKLQEISKTMEKSTIKIYEDMEKQLYTTVENRNSLIRY